MTWKPGPQSTTLFERAKQRIPGGVNSPVRAFGSVGLTPFFVSRAQGPYVWDEDGNRYIDFVGSWGPMILGHRPEAVHQALVAAAKDGTSFGAPHRYEVELAERICDRFASVDSVRLVNSGTEATMSAIRLARGATGRDKIVKFAGCYHGHADAFLIQAGSGAATLGVPSSPGVPQGAAADTLVAPYNDLEAVRGLFSAHGDDIAAVIVEPVAGNMGCVPPLPDFLPGLRALCDDHGALLIFDEVITGFRVARGGAQERYGVRADLTTMGKVLGGGLPIGAFGGRADIMAHLAPQGPVYQAGTLSGNPLAVRCGIAVLDALDAPGVYDALERKGAALAAAISDAAAAHGVPLTLNRVGSMMGFFLHDGPVRSYADAAAARHDLFPALFSALLEHGVAIAPSGYECLFAGLAHDDDTLTRAADAFDAAFARLAESTRS